MATKQTKQLTKADIQKMYTMYTSKKPGSSPKMFFTGKEEITSAFGKAHYMHVSKVQSYEGEEKGLQGGIKVKKNDPETKIMIDQINGLVKQVELVLKHSEHKIPDHKFKKKNKLLPYEPVLDENGKETDEILFKFSIKCKSEDNRHIPAFDSNGDLMNNKDVPEIGNGSEVRVGLLAIPYDAGMNYGVTLRWSSVQIIKIETYDPNSTKTITFGKVVRDGAFTAGSVAPKNDEVIEDDEVLVDDEVIADDEVITDTEVVADEEVIADDFSFDTLFTEDVPASDEAGEYSTDAIS